MLGKTILFSDYDESLAVFRTHVDFNRFLNKICSQVNIAHLRV